MDVQIPDHARAAIVAAARLEEHRAAAIRGVLEVLAEWSMMPFPSITCSEADRLAIFARTFGDAELAEALLSAHADSDGPEDSHYAGG